MAYRPHHTQGNRNAPNFPPYPQSRDPYFDDMGRVEYPEPLFRPKSPPKQQQNTSPSLPARPRPPQFAVQTLTANGHVHFWSNLLTHCEHGDAEAAVELMLSVVESSAPIKLKSTMKSGVSVSTKPSSSSQQSSKGRGSSSAPKMNRNIGYNADLGAAVKLEFDLAAPRSPQPAAFFIQVSKMDGWGSYLGWYWVTMTAMLCIWFPQAPCFCHMQCLTMRLHCIYVDCWGLGRRGTWLIEREGRTNKSHSLILKLSPRYV